MAHERIAAGDERHARAPDVDRLSLCEEHELIDLHVDEATGAEVALHTDPVISRAERGRVAERMRDDAHGLVPVVLITDERAVIVARLDDHEPASSDDHDRHAVAAVAARIA